ncbi:polysaccharide biosynthesis tyrosine autokinase [Botrimarina sp.]|uniref:polysaccharide biosynthesis tyrosine autokinase n=1 Tax=Botrimarina sp. TaxID=2795802 RepID=UPI0032ECB342
MSVNENGNIASPESGASLVPTNPVAVGALTGVHGPIGQPVAAGGNDVLKGGMDRSGLMHALRRRWLLASTTGLLLSAAVAAGLYWLFPPTNSASTQFQVASNPMTLLDRTAVQTTTDYDIFKGTQIAYLKSPFVLNAALRNERYNIAKLPFFDDADDKVEYLQDELLVSFPNNGEILEVTLSGPYPEQELKDIVEAVCASYYDEVLFRDRTSRARPLQILQGSLKDLKEIVYDKMTEYQTLAEEAGSSAVYQGGFDPETKLMLSEVMGLLNRRSKIEEEIGEATMQFKVFEAQINDPTYQEQLAQQQMSMDPMISQMQQMVMYYQMQIRSEAALVKRGTSARIRQLEKQVQELQQEIAMAQQQMLAQIAGERSNDPNPLLKTQTMSYTIMRQMKQAELAQIDQEFEKLKQDLYAKAKNNTDLMLRLAEIEQLREVEQGIATKIQNLTVESEAPARITAVSADPAQRPIANTFNNRNQLQRYAISGLGGLTALVLTCLAIGYAEFSKRRLNGPDQVDEGLGIRVIGTLPRLGGKSGSHSVFAQLSESIDSVRTALMHESTKKKRQLVLVTSPETAEGRTTVASQLAASLARAGRRTLLIDGDMRRPALHSLFNQPLEDGLCEVLRTEAEVTDVIRPTQAEGLWLMTAGYCDSDAVRALATDQVQPIFDKLRADYDFIIIDGAPVIGVADSLLFGQHCDGAILSVLRDQSSVTRIHQSVEMLRGVGVRLIGAVVNGVSSKADRRVTHLQQVTPKRQQPKLEMVEN